MGQDVRSPRGPRCIALVGPFQSGKTTLLEAIMARTGAIPRAGSVDQGTSVGDASPEARHHKMGTGLTAATTTFMGDSYTFVDCPGSVEFAHDMRAALPARGTAPVRANIASKSVVLPLWNGPTSAMHRGPRGLLTSCPIAASSFGARPLIGSAG